MRRFLVVLFISCACAVHVCAQQAPPSAIVVFWEQGFPAVDTPPPSRNALAAALPDAAFAAAGQLTEALNRKETRLLVLPYGSAFPEEQWSAIDGFLRRGGNLMVVGGQAFVRPAYREADSWKLRPATKAYSKRLFLNDYHVTPGSQSMQRLPNDSFAHLNLPPFEWVRGFSPVIRMSDEDLYPRGGSAGSIDARLDTLVWGVKDGRRLSAPVIQIDHLKNLFAGGRWILVSCEPAADFFSGAAGNSLLASLAQHAMQGAEEFAVRPSWALFLPGEPLSFQMRWQRFGADPAKIRVQLTIAPEGQASAEHSFDFSPAAFPFSTQLALPTVPGKGLHRVTAQLFEGRVLRAEYRTGFWIRDEAYLRSGPRVSVNADLFEINGKSQLVMGTTYMASDVQRQFFMQPNPFVWDRDLAELRRAGFNMIRTGWWSAWDQVMKENGVVHEEMLRALEAFLMTARKHELPVQFTFFAFIPEVLGGSNPYLDPEALRRQKSLITAAVDRFKDVPWLMWDLINEASFSNPTRLWSTRPNRDWHEQNAWNRWLKERYPSRAAMAEAWRSIPIPDSQPVPLPEEEEFSPRAAAQTSRFLNSLRVFDYNLFAQESFRSWVAEMRGAIRSTGSRQLVTVGQDEGGVRETMSPAFFSDVVDFTTNHTWWMLDALLWDSLAAKQPGKPMLVQETGIAHQWQIDDTSRKTLEEEAVLLERKLAFATGAGAGAIHWLWHINSYMRDDGEVRIGAIRADGTEKPEADVLRKFSAFAAASAGQMAQAKPPQVAIAPSQSFHYSALSWLAYEVEMKSTRVLHYYCRVPAYVVAENQLPHLGNPRLVILPSAHTLSDEAWQTLVRYVADGGNLLLTGSAERDVHWRARHRLAALGLDAAPRAVIQHQSQIRIDGQSIPVAIRADNQAFVEGLSLAGGETFRELAHGRGKIFVAAFPVETAEGFDATARVYDAVLRKLGIAPSFEGQSPSPGILIRPVEFKDSVLYLFVSESGQDEEIAVKDSLTGAELKFRLPAQRARLVLLRKSDGRVLAEYAP